MSALEPPVVADVSMPAATSSPSLGPAVTAKRRRSGSDDEGSFLLEGGDATRVRARIDASLQQDMQRRIRGSLQETSAELEATYPEESREGIQRARQRASSELSDFVRSRECTPLLGPQPSPALGPTRPPAIGLSTPPPAAALLGATASPAMSPAVSPAPRMAAALSPALPPLGLAPALPPSAASPGVEPRPMAKSPPLAPLLPPLEIDVSEQGMYSHEGLLDHEQLMRAIYESQGLDFAAVQGQAQSFLQKLGLRPHDMGVQNVDETGRTLINQCFYLSIARGYLGHCAGWSETSELALRLKRAIESAVLAERPGWAGLQDSENGEGCGEAMAFADFLPLAMKASSAQDAELNVLAELAVCILDSTAGHVEVYLGAKYKELEDEGTMAQNLVLLWYTPGHYQCLVNNDEGGSKVSMTYSGFKEVLTTNGVVYIETLE